MDLDDATTMIGELLNHYQECYNEEPDFDPDNYEAQLDAMSDEELQEEYRTHILNQ
jgi:hypothetical protein